jgi:uncharacterized membrane protein
MRRVRRSLGEDEEARMRTFARWMLAGAMVFAGLSHLFWARRDFQAQVPDWAVREAPAGISLDKDAVVVASGVVETAFGAALIVLPRERRRIGALLAAFFVAVFPGNVDQWRKRRSAFGLDTDRRRFGRLFFQPVLVAWALWSTR